MIHLAISVYAVLGSVKPCCISAALDVLESPAYREAEGLLVWGLAFDGVVVNPFESRPPVHSLHRTGIPETYWAEGKGATKKKQKPKPLNPKPLNPKP